MAKPPSKSPAQQQGTQGTQQARKSFALRLDPAVHAAIERVAANELRSSNAQIEMLLREALKARGINVGHSDRPRRGRPPKVKASQKQNKEAR